MNQESIYSSFFSKYLIKNNNEFDLEKEINAEQLFLSDYEILLDSNTKDETFRIVEITENSNYSLIDVISLCLLKERLIDNISDAIDFLSDCSLQPTSFDQLQKLISISSKNDFKESIKCQVNMSDYYEVLNEWNDKVIAQKSEKKSLFGCGGLLVSPSGLTSYLIDSINCFSEIKPGLLTLKQRPASSTEAM